MGTCVVDNIELNCVEGLCESSKQQNAACKYLKSKANAMSLDASAAPCTFSKMTLPPGFNNYKAILSVSDPGGACDNQPPRIIIRGNL